MYLERSELIKTMEAGLFALSLILLAVAQSPSLTPVNSIETASPLVFSLTTP